MELLTLEEAKKIQVKIDELKRRIDLLERFTHTAKVCFTFNEVKDYRDFRTALSNHYIDIFTVDEDTKVTLINHYKDLIDCYLEDLKKL